MHVHANQFDPNLQLSNLQTAEAKKNAEQVRKKLLNAASALAGDYGDEPDCIVSLGAKQESQNDGDQSQDHEPPAQSGKEDDLHEEETQADGGDSSSSFYA